MAKVASKLMFYASLTLSSLLSLMLLSAAANFGFRPVIAAGPISITIVAVTILSPVVFGTLGFAKGTPRWQTLAAVAMLTLLLFYTLIVFGYFGPLSG